LLLSVGFALSQVIAKTREDSFRRPVLHGINFEPVILIGIAFQNDIDVPVSACLRKVNWRPRYNSRLNPNELLGLVIGRFGP
jgi:hypothetical protein